ncbi:carbon monoxide dehydrogenase subunit G [Variovorax paradoxus]|jgi:carbon monoxide dehydrogenase subunit G|uniref:SRPBCC family protein n=1 Tax=Variovorax paradoxus TaxID=34073 RepID=UPI002783AA1F|nr:carbon monoxide dehydrogenase subunit G [Variovorax paradoxus]MDQ0027633.1 carbon monoxide dehydrogenase subunit G [Variovorax paradoxus]
MQITGSQSIAAPRHQVWAALNDPEILKGSLPGCESVERVSPELFRVVVVSAIGPLRAKFRGDLRLTQAQPPQSCVMVFEGQGGAVGFGKGQATVELLDVGGATELRYSAQAQVGGKLAQIGSRLIDSVARKMSDDFFEAFRKLVVPAPSPSITAEAGTAASVSAERSGWIPVWMYFAGSVVAAIVLSGVLLR